MKINLLDSKFENNQFSSDAILAQAEAIKIAKKTGLDWYNNLEYHQEHQYINFSIEKNQIKLDFQLLIKEKELYYRFPMINNNPVLSKMTNNLIGYLGNMDVKTHKFYTLDAVKNFIILIENSIE